MKIPFVIIIVYHPFVKMLRIFYFFTKYIYIFQRALLPE
ncbi:hypothetical protein SBF1_540004 [Candidatus Desulfosporosinus infrequens]|uniref:Uncharacterized protein n=1 Tax=Candidatus Desulfosporosinus infrequens TaxID=2043169 RepID=A0A2U3LJ30_9FIRM|nr:hypothetical protein SBF1_540004 [Candidatus Desulfosporosinus infrequens]